MIDRSGSVLGRLLALMVRTVILIVLFNGALKAARMFMVHPALQAATVTRTAFELQQIAAVIEGEELLTGTYPTDFTQFMIENFDRKSGGDTTTDPWGNSYHFENKEREFVVYSAGPDGALHTTDDLYIKRVKPRWRHSRTLRM